MCGADGLILTDSAMGGGGGLVCQAPVAPFAVYAPVLVSLNGVDYTEFPSDDGVAGVYGAYASFYAHARARGVSPAPLLYPLPAIAFPLIRASPSSLSFPFYS